ncbi:MAG: hypothetical protein HC828_04825 [Blastochloris sp.]|nr:hypothetical protein [Blastochloris sp.]
MTEKLRRAFTIALPSSDPASSLIQQYIATLEAQGVDVSPVLRRDLVQALTQSVVLQRLEATLTQLQTEVQALRDQVADLQTQPLVAMTPAGDPRDDEQPLENLDDPETQALLGTLFDFSHVRE